MTASGCYRLRPEGLDLFVRLTPKSSSDRLDGMAVASDGSAYLAARVRAVPEKGAANTALERLLALQLSLPKRSVSVIAGGTSRLKTVRLSGDATEIAGRIEAILLSPAGKSGST